MASLALIYVFYVSVFHLQSTIRGKQICKSQSCGDIDIQFPFGLKESNQDRSCSYYPNPSFQLSCDNQSRAILSLPNSGDLVVKSIDYETQTIQVNDPDGCLPKRYMRDWNLSGSPFKPNPVIYTHFNLTFLRCPSNVTESFRLPLEPIPCLSDNNGNGNGNSSSSNNNNSNSSSVIVSWVRPIVSSTLSSQTCEVISSHLVPLPSMDMPMWPFWPDLNSDVGLVWTEPRCGDCALSGQVCGFSDKDEKGLLRVGCFPSPSSSKGMFFLFPHWPPLLSFSVSHSMAAINS